MPPRRRRAGVAGLASSAAGCAGSVRPAQRVGGSRRLDRDRGAPLVVVRDMQPVKDRRGVPEDFEDMSGADGARELIGKLDRSLDHASVAKMPGDDQELEVESELLDGEQRPGGGATLPPK